MSDRPKKTDDELLALLDCPPESGTFWRHYKGGQYMVLSRVILEATQEPLVVYQNMASCITFARPLSEWEEIVEHEGKPVPRFQPQRSVTP